MYKRQDQGIAVADAYGAEHLEIHTSDARDVARRIRNAGAIFVGPYAPVPLGDYSAGSTHVLPTSGTAAHSSGPVSYTHQMCLRDRAHTAAYGVISYWTAYLKANYPAEYMAALLESVKGDKDKPPVYLAECRRMGIKVLPPDVNESVGMFTPVAVSYTHLDVYKRQT